jgi:hypothetical protein
LVEVICKSVEMGRPQPAVGLQPVIELYQRLRPDSVQTALSVGADVHQAGLFEDAKML